MNQYSNFLKTSENNFQIIVKTKKEKIKKYCNKINSENKELLEDYYNQIYEITKNNDVYLKEFYIIVSEENTGNYSFDTIKRRLCEKIDVISNELKQCENRINDFSNLTEKEFIKLISTFFNEEENFYESI